MPERGTTASQPIRALLFDLDGVLVDTYEVWFAVINHCAAAAGYPGVSRARFRSAWGQGVDADVRDFFPGSTVAEVEAAYDAAFLDHLDALAVTPGGPELLRGLRDRGLPTCVITNTPAPLARRLLARAALEPDRLVGGTDVPRPKPAPDMVLRACELLKVAPAEAAVIGDSAFDREAAAAAGAPFVGYRCDGGIRIESLREIPGLLRSRG